MVRRRLKRAARFALALWAGAAAAVPAGAWAQEATIVAGGPGQKAMALLPADDGIFVRVCADAKGCDAREGDKLRPPASFRGRSSEAKVDVLTLASGKRVALASVAGEPGRSFQVLVAAPAAVGPARVIWSGVTGRGEGTGRFTELSVDRDDKGRSSVRLVSRAPLCGKEVTTGTRTLDGAKLELRSSPAVDPLGAARAASQRLEASPVDEGAPSFRILRGRAASSGQASAIADGDPATSWMEDDKGVGLHAFVSLSAPQSIPIEGFELVFLPPAGVAQPRAPKAVTLVTDGASFAVELPRAGEGATFGVKLPARIRSACVALVIDEVHPADKGAPRGSEPTTYVSELRARTTLDAASLSDVARGLAGGGEAAKEKLAVLEAEGKRGLDAIIEAYPGLDGPGRDLARRVVDAMSCERKLALYLPLLVGSDKEESDRARDRVRRCGKEAAAPLLAKLEASEGAARATYAEEAALVAPDASVPVLLAALAKAGTSDERRSLRRALGKAAGREVGVRALGRAISADAFATLPLVTRIDVLRALGDEAARAEGASKALAAAAGEAKSFRDRYLVLGPAAVLAKGGDAQASAVLRKALGAAAEPKLRARAAALAGGVAGLHQQLLEAIDDPEVRVREAALASLASGKTLGGPVANKLLARLTEDPWTFVRRAAAAALVRAPESAEIDRRIAGAVDFEAAPAVRSEMVKTLGQRRAKDGKTVVQERAFDRQEALDVRVHAIEALGALCDRSQVEALTEIALVGRSPVFEADRKLAVAAIAALGALAPGDLGARLAPLRSDKAPAEIREVSRRVLAQKARPCKGTP
jgi:hypothetical protein